MRIKERGDAVLGLLVIGLIVIFGFWLWYSIDYQRRYDYFGRSCRDHGGVVQDNGFTRVDCFKDGKLIQVPGGSY